MWFINNANGIGWSAALTTSMNSTFDTDAYDYTFVDGQGHFEVQIEAMNNAIADKDGDKIFCVSLQTSL